MQVNSVSTVSVASAPASPGAVPQLLGKQGELASSGTFAPVDEVSIAYKSETQDLYSPVQRKLSRQQSQATTSSNSTQDTETSLSDEDVQLVQDLKQRDQEVRAHEQAHSSVGGQHTGNASFSYQTGPDGVRYAVGGEVNADLSEVSGDPQATANKMEQLQRAALAPAEPSDQDRQVAAKAGQLAAKALTEIADEQRNQQREEVARLEAERAGVKADLEAAKKEQKEAEEKDAEEQAVSAAERLAEYNAKLRRINEVLLRISLPAPVNAGQLLDDMA
ncbi:putative metalloprotease CJM1_0395 family protein [Thalassolituus sp. LLYu03]|uniref:putative metalloprotease CJM1_0395 family protein n=1 Tax=Thalassolituus sp. LLYu03 TaxID=3421656 RepID=UPI003D2655DC